MPVHLWYEQRFRWPLSRYDSAEQAIATWPTTGTSIGARSGGGAVEVCAPFGLTDLFAMVVRSNTTLITRCIYEARSRVGTSCGPA